ncbi:helix-turn-helix transcriptional regulator [Rhizobium sp. AQ_MP]|uniref:PadR family transcriptional regulator n=1 Tax=Rhizobium sp. AQ_MP TaxID=2761536 RepID=UPI00163A5843|nr:helix-turn-helix transcriptional regulator [Rhizobium sp. AQ_MP]MBC2773430.1 helix-turn-helix transcriptional regulator [Rhizobium sp. AQ_MP]
MNEQVHTAIRQPEAEVRELGSFELKLLASINKLQDRAWGSNLQSDLSQLTGRDVAIGQLYLALSKLEKKGMISASKSDPEPVRGGRSKKVFRLETPGARALERTVSFLEAPRVLRPQENNNGEFAH